MKLDLSTDQKVFQSTARKFLDKELSLTTVREMVDTGTACSPAWWEKAAGLGWASMLVPEELGGGSMSGEGLVDLTIVAEEAGRGVAPGPLIPVNTVIAGLVEVIGQQAHHAVALEALMAGETIASWAVYEPGDGWDPLAARTVAKQGDSGFVIDGVKDRVELADQAGLFLVTAMAGEGPTQFLVPAAAVGVTVESSGSVDSTRRFGEVRFDKVEVPLDAVVGTVGDAAPVIERQLQVALVLQAAETCGLLEAVFDFTVQWAFDRFSFGRPLASYQALKHRFADMRTWLEACQSTATAAAVAVQQRSLEAPELVSVAKSYIGDRSTDIIQDCVQMHGGIGVTWEHDLHLFLRRATVSAVLFGTPADHRRRIAEILTD